MLADGLARWLAVASAQRRAEIADAVKLVTSASVPRLVLLFGVVLKYVVVIVLLVGILQASFDFVVWGTGWGDRGGGQGGGDA